MTASTTKNVESEKNMTIIDRLRKMFARREQANEAQRAATRDALVRAGMLSLY